jgi:hypothetical protein
MALALAPFGVLAKSQFFRLCAEEHNRNYALTLFMCSTNSAMAIIA